jgi:hypothetical protein
MVSAAIAAGWAVVDGIEAFAAWVRSSRTGAAANPARYDAAR